MAKILIVEDDAYVRRLYRRTFVFEKFDVEMAENGQQGLEKAASYSPDLIILDILMEGIDGIEVLKRLKKHDKTKQIPVIMLTAVTDDHRIHLAFELGAAGYMVKSEYTPKQVVGAVKQLLGTN